MGSTVRRCMTPVRRQRMTIPGPDTVTISGLLREGMVNGHMPFLTVSSGSMAPLLRVGDEIGLQAIKANQLCRGDIIAVSDRNQVLTHRFIGLRDIDGRKRILTRGDRALRDDRPWTEEQLLGRVVARRRGRQKFWLDFGAGYRLNRALARLARLEHGIVQPLRAADSSQPITRTERLVLVLFWQLSSTLTRAVEWIA